MWLMILMWMIAMNEAVLYSYVRCPYAARARLALIFAGINCQLREVDLAHKPAEMLQLSPKGSVPVLQLADGRVIDESLDIMHWATTFTVGANLLPIDIDAQANMAELIRWLDNDFSKQSFRYRFRLANDPHPPIYYRNQAEEFLSVLEAYLNQNRYIFGDSLSLGDLAVYPFLRSFVDVEPEWFVNTPYAHLHRWLALMSENKIVQQAFVVNKTWQNGDPPLYLMAA
jgi:glutathione S-transferase